MRRSTLLGVLLLTITTIALPWPAGAETRIALVIGNSAYPSGPLGSPKDDAEAVAKKLSDLGFAVTKLTNLGGPALRKAIRDFGQRLEQPETVGLFYYSGHGMQVNNHNYMIPIDAEIRDEADVEEAGVPMENVLRRMELGKSNTNIVILDACRDNPFEKRLKSAQAGLAAMRPPTSTLIAFAAAPGTVAKAASGGRLSPYTEALLEHIDTPGQDLIKMFQMVQNAVWQRTQGHQNPHVEFTPGLPDFSFSPAVAISAESPKIEKAALTRSFTDQRYLYVFDFDFVNTLQQPIEIMSVNVFDVNGRRLEQDWVASGRNWDPRLMTHTLSGNHPLVEIISKPRGTPLEQATVSPVGDRIEIKVTNRILSAGEAIRPSLYILSSKNKYDSLVLRVAYRINGTTQEVIRTFTV